jgi:hypothetical protein
VDIHPERTPVSREGPFDVAVPVAKQGPVRCGRTVGHRDPVDVPHLIVYLVDGPGGALGEGHVFWPFDPGGRAGTVRMWKAHARDSRSKVAACAAASSSRYWASAKSRIHTGNSSAQYSKDLRELPQWGDFRSRPAE